MEEKMIHLDLNDQELNVVWGTLMSGTVTGQNAPHVVTVMQKIQMAINAVNAPKEEVKEAEVEEGKK